MGRLARAIIAHLVADCPPAMAACFDCNETECQRERFENCQRRIVAAGERKKEEIAMLTDRIPYVCSRCQYVTYAPSGLVAVTCAFCGVIDLGTEIARQRWRSVAEVRLASRPERKRAEHVPLRVVAAWALAAALGCALVVLLVLRVAL